MDAPPFTALKQVLKRVTSQGVVDVAALLKRGFEFLSTIRCATEGEDYGQGYCFGKAGCAGHIVLITDGVAGGSVMSGLSPAHMITDIKLTCPGSEVYNTPYRCEQHLWGVLLQFPGVGGGSMPAFCNVAAFDHPVAALAIDTGGACKAVQSLQSIPVVAELLASNCAPGTVSIRMVAAELDSNSVFRLDESAQAQVVNISILQGALCIE